MMKVIIFTRSSHALVVVYRRANGYIIIFVYMLLECVTYFAGFPFCNQQVCG